MADFSPLHAQIDVALATMKRAEDAVKAHVDHLAAAAESDATAILSVVQKIKAGSDSLQAAIAAAEQPGQTS